LVRPPLWVHRSSQRVEPSILQEAISSAFAASRRRGQVEVGAVPLQAVNQFPARGEVLLLPPVQRGLHLVPGSAHAAGMLQQFDQLLITAPLH